MALSDAFVQGSKFAKVIPGIGTAISLAGQAFGMAKAAKEQKKNQALLNKQIEENEADYNNEANKSFLETNAAKDAVKLADQNLIDSQKQAAGASVITGASDEAKVAGMTGVNKNYNDTVSRIAAAGTGFQERAKNRYQANRMALNDRQAQLNQAKAEGAANLAGNAGDLLDTLTMDSGLNEPKAGGVTGRTQQTQDKLTNIAQSAFKKY